MKTVIALLLVLTSTARADEGDTGWQRPAGARFSHGVRVGWMYLEHYDKPTREDGSSLMEEFGLKSPHMMLLGYEAVYRVVGRSWLDVIIVGNGTVAGLEQAKFIPAASALIGAEFARKLQLGVGVNLTPDREAPTHAILAVGFTPSVGSIQTPVHVFVVPDADHNSRYGATVGVTW